MRLPDELLPDYYRLVMESEEDPLDGDPMEAKLRLARFIVTRAHGEDEALTAEEHFTRVVREGQPPEEVPEVVLPDVDPVHLPALLADGVGVGSTSEARRLLNQGAVRLNGEVVTELDVPRATLVGALLQVGKRRFARLTAL
jgi:tyrosyl-tRNA synthetase